MPSPPSPKRQRTEKKETGVAEEEGEWGEKALLRDFKGEGGEGSCSIPYAPSIPLDHPIKKLLFETNDEVVQEALLLALSEISQLTCQ
jgi:hypothetical protein